jgi:long-chain acyl-CoA synthetase
MLGYYKDTERTAEVFTADGWFKTGDLGSFDKKNRLFIRGRLKAMILGPSGENIYPEEIESILNASGVVEESLVYEGEKGELVALVVLNEKAKSMFATAGDMLQGAAQAMGDAAQGAAQVMGDAAQGAAQAMGDAAQGAAQAVGDAAQGAVHAVGDAAQAVGDAAQGAARSVGAAAHHAGEALGNLKSATNKRLAAFSRIHRIEVQDEPFEKTATQKIKRFLYPKKK